MTESYDKRAEMDSEATLEKARGEAAKGRAEQALADAVRIKAEAEYFKEVGEISLLPSDPDCEKAYLDCRKAIGTGIVSVLGPMLLIHVTWALAVVKVVLIIWVESKWLQ